MAKRLPTKLLVAVLLILLLTGSVLGQMDTEYISCSPETNPHTDGCDCRSVLTKGLVWAMGDGLKCEPPIQAAAEPLLTATVTRIPLIDPVGPAITSEELYTVFWWGVIIAIVIGLGIKVGNWLRRDSRNT